MRKSFVISAAIGLSLSAYSYASVLMIDDFVSASPAAGWYVDMDDIAGAANVDKVSNISESGLAGIPGGSRDTTITAKTVNRNPYGWMNHSISAGISPTSSWDGRTGMMSMSTAWGGRGVLDLGYDANGSGMNLDLTGGTHVAATFWVDHLGLGTPSKLEFKLVDGDGTVVVLSKIWSAHVTVSDWLTVAMPLNLPVDFDITDVDSLEVTYVADDANDMAYDAIWFEGPTLVPEPTSLAFLLLGNVVLLRRRMRH